MTTSLDNNWGALTFPIPQGSSNDLTALDPARDILLGLLEAAINFELADAWLSTSTGTDLQRPVGSTLPGLDDLDTMRQRGVTFPLLAVARSGDPQTVDELTLWQSRITSKWTVDYVLGPLEIGDQLRLGDALTAVGKIVSATLKNGGHKAYATTPTSDGSASAKQVLGVGTGCANFSTYWVTSFIQGAAAFSMGGPKYHAMTITLQTTELDSIADEGVSYAGAGVTVGNPSEVAKTDADVELDTAVPLQTG